MGDVRLRNPKYSGCPSQSPREITLLIDCSGIPEATRKIKGRKGSYEQCFIDVESKEVLSHSNIGKDGRRSLGQEQGIE